MTFSIRSISNHGLRSRRQRRPRPKIDFLQRPISQRIVRPRLLVETKSTQMRPGFQDRGLEGRIVGLSHTLHLIHLKLISISTSHAPVEQNSTPAGAAANAAYAGP